MNRSEKGRADSGEGSTPYIIAAHSQSGPTTARSPRCNRKFGLRCGFLAVARGYPVLCEVIASQPRQTIRCCALDSLHRVIWHVQRPGISGKGRVFFLAGVDLTKITHGDHPRCANLMRIFQCFSSPSVSPPLLPAHAGITSAASGRV